MPCVSAHNPPLGALSCWGWSTPPFMALLGCQPHYSRCRRRICTGRPTTLLGCLPTGSGCPLPRLPEAPAKLALASGQRVWLSSQDLPLKVELSNLAPRCIGPVAVDQIGHAPQAAFLPRGVSNVPPAGLLSSHQQLSNVRSFRLCQR